MIDHEQSTLVAEPRPQDTPSTNGYVLPQAPSDNVAPARGPKRRMVAIGVGVAGFLLGVGIGAASGGKTDTVVRVPPARTVTQTVKSVRTKVKKVPVVHVQTRTVTKTVTAPAPVTPAPASSGAGAASANTFTGTGSESLGTITVPTDSTLRWTCSSCTETGMLIDSDLNADENAIEIMQTATHGESAISAGTYRNVHVDADGDFTITIS